MPQRVRNPWRICSRPNVSGITISGLYSTYEVVLVCSHSQWFQHITTTFIPRSPFFALLFVHKWTWLINNSYISSCHKRMAWWCSWICKSCSTSASGSIHSNGRENRDIYTGTKRSSGWLPSTSLEMLKVAFNVSGDEQGSHPDGISGPLFTKKTPSYGYRDPHDKHRTVWRPSQVYNGNPYTD